MASTATTAATTVSTVTTTAATMATAVTVVASVPQPVMSVALPPTSAAPSMPFDVRLIPEYNGSTDVVEWFTRTEMLCQLRGVAVETVLPLRLSGGAFSVWSQLPADSRSSLSVVRGALYAAFALDKYAAYEAFSARRLQHGESADVFLADLRRLAELFGGLPDQALVCAFVAGLPDAVRQTIRAGSRAENLSLVEVVVRARAVLSDERVVAAAAAAQYRRASPLPRNAAPTGQRSTPESAPPEPDTRAPRPAGGGRYQRRCWTCGSPQHLAAACPRRAGNPTGEDERQPASSPARC